MTDKAKLKLEKEKSGINLISELKKLFALMTIGNKKYTEPSAVLQSVIDEFGQKVQIGEEKDINEFKSILIARIADAFNHGKPEKEEGSEEVKIEAE